MGKRHGGSKLNVGGWFDRVMAMGAAVTNNQGMVYRDRDNVIDFLSFKLVGLK